MTNSIDAVMPVNGKILETLWNPVEIFKRPRQVKYAVLITNRPISLSEDVVMPIWKEAMIKIAIDGGADVWLEYIGPLAEEIFKGNYPELVPTLITGDFDSILPETLNKFKSLEVQIIETQDQNYTDLSKALIQLAVHCKTRNISLDVVYVFVGNGGRFDHIMATINTLYKSKTLMGDNHVEKIILVSGNSLSWLLRAGKHRIKIPEILHEKNSWAGLIPMGCTANASTTGLKWNPSTPLNFGGMVSTSNTYDGSPEVTVNTDSDIIWTMGIEPLLEMTNIC
ncbi:thiamin pyrophosphokinase 1 isoform X2 [Fopius arisanus]|uniref:Thiamin pyrophosphokinase 1 isoform X2 n=1 Tax=Fopius arisanus TaxID=64838 RepID=A0A0C9RUM1_9HYME|nr:PREDICTED: thiamin pyrophosphokinase 1 isoform X2 [Fopius arisanus]XP_011304138.1 PREDICTED: thiamin pyrophosphokinase 1 isoform X2 [Fopius arisanus]XP_011304139.1 PREDICTED: thiamin pyrophosphokinase 1 isoform X2 [Fopius arisanus]XP_011304140.1 PREDICTED: thiamin pyrophosphokinase 1 isoform X2 [Fopius arisanus]XP_011304141.1 PREDICTED: thiamin pyrophosphokinase 1 isoform X2 [Fopius arisanus]